MIDYLTDGNGDLVMDKDWVASIITDFYKGLLGSSTANLVGIDLRAMWDGPQLSQAQALELIKPISSDDVVAALHSIDDTKSPRLDGFNSLFFKKAWRIVGHDNVTAITLVPKVANASHVKDLGLSPVVQLFTRLLQKSLLPGFKRWCVTL